MYVLFTSDNLFWWDEKIIFRSKKSFSHPPQIELSDINKTFIGISNGQKFKLTVIFISGKYLSGLIFSYLGYCKFQVSQATSGTSPDSFALGAEATGLPMSFISILSIFFLSNLSKFYPDSIQIFQETHLIQTVSNFFQTLTKSQFYPAFVLFSQG